MDISMIVMLDQANQILRNIEFHLLRDKGVIRYMNDQYYNHGYGEPEWTMGLPWLAIIYKQLGRPDKYSYFMMKTIKAMNEKGELPELYFANSNAHNENTPLGWSQSLFLVMMSMQEQG
jgi:phosphorylase kinase alpha/beta subunit